MKKTFLMLSLLFISVISVAQGINFQDLTFEQALAKAKEENKLVFIDNYTDWCGPCIMMTRDIFPMKEMGDYFNPKYISVKYNSEKGEEGPAVKKRFGITAYPTFLILDGDGNLIHMFAGGVLGLGFIDKVEESFNPDLAFGPLKKRYDSGERNVKLVINYIKALQNTHTVDVTSMIEDFANSLTTEELISKDALFLFDDHAQLGSPREKFISENIEKFRSAVDRETIDNIMKKKYIVYYSRIIGKQRALNEADFQEKNKQLAALNLTNAKILDVYQESVKTYISKEGIDNVYNSIINSASKVHQDEMDILLYYVVPSLAGLWSKEQATSLISIINSERAKESVIKALERIQKS
jgi:thiol-disulfide isomerase/thioredoxin